MFRFLILIISMLIICCLAHKPHLALSNIATVMLGSRNLFGHRASGVNTNHHEG